MRKLTLLAVAILLIAGTAGAIVDPAPNSMGIYFDPSAEIYEWSGAPYTPFNAYVCLIQPDFDSVYGYEFGYTIVGTYGLMSVLLEGEGPIDVGGGGGNHLVGLAAPFETNPVTVLATLQIFPADDEPIHFTLHGASPNSVHGSATPAVLAAGDAIIATGLSAWDEASNSPAICATFNDFGVVVATDKVSFDEVKSLYR